MCLGNKGTKSLIKQFAVGYHNAVKKILGVSSHESNHYACQETGLFTFKHLLNKMKVLSVFRIFQAPCNCIARNLAFFSISSVFRRNILETFHEDYGIENVFENDKDAVISRIIFTQNHEETMR